MSPAIPPSPPPVPPLRPITVAPPLLIPPEPPAPDPNGPDDPPDPNDPPFVVPDTTELYDADALDDVGPGNEPNQATVTVRAGAPVPPVEGHVAISPTTDLPDGMFATVVAARPTGSGSTILTLQQAAVDEVLDQVNIDYDTAGEMTVVDQDGNPTGDSSPIGQSLVMSGLATARSAARGQSGMFTCGESGGVPHDPEDLWSSGNPFPVELKFENSRVHHRFDAGSWLPRRDPYLLFQFSSQAVVSIGVQAKTAFSCELSTSYRRNHRIRIRAGSVGPVPITVYIEPQFSFEVSAAGSITVNQRHYLSFTFEKRGFNAPEFRRGSSKDTPDWDIDAQIDASLFAGGDLSVMLGGGYKSANAQAGIHGAVGPEFSLTGAAQRPGCVHAEVGLKAELGFRLELWVKRWNYNFASLSLLHQPLGQWCVLDPLDPENYVGQWSNGQIVRAADGSLSVLAGTTWFWQCGSQPTLEPGTEIRRRMRPSNSGQWEGDALYWGCSAGSPPTFAPAGAMRAVRSYGQILIRLASALYSNGSRPTIDRRGNVSAGGHGVWLYPRIPD